MRSSRGRPPTKVTLFDRYAVYMDSSQCPHGGHTVMRWSRILAGIDTKVHQQHLPRAYRIRKPIHNVVLALFLNEITVDYLMHLYVHTLDRILLTLVYWTVIAYCIGFWKLPAEYYDVTEEINQH